MMAALLNWNSIAALALDRMLYCLAEGVALAALLSLAMRLFPPKSSRTRFAVGFSALVALAMLPVLGAVAMPAAHAKANLPGANPHEALLTIPASWAAAVFVVWATLALLGLLRVAAGVWHVRRLRQSCVAINPELLRPELRSGIADLKLSRPVSILVSPSASVPAAVGFFKPAVVVPAWLAEESAAGELQYVLLHELAHLRRWDDWTNLVQKIVKAILFFHPGIWWIERKLSLDREMACDEAVLMEKPEPRMYAQCLARVAEKSFLRRQLALAQAAVDRMKHLSQRIQQILSLSENRDNQQRTRLWKPAVAMVTAAGALGTIWTSQAPQLVRVAGPASSIARVAPGFSSPLATGTAASEVERRQTSALASTLAASANTKALPAIAVPAVYSPRRADKRSTQTVSQGRKPAPRETRNPDLIRARYALSEPASDEATPMLVTLVETRFVTGGPAATTLWQVSVIE
ncbi:MAG TPA: M56 family metallopeptidase, partial [Candidatus Angelobacter sp.]|nr:M56 family metallopeptidase [Candidatus Angelobacter sp.]